MKYLFGIVMTFILAMTGFVSHSQVVKAESGSSNDDSSESSNDDSDEDSDDDSDEDSNDDSDDDSDEDSNDDSDDDKGGMRDRANKIRDFEFKKEREDWRKALEISKDEFKIKREETKAKIDGVKSEFEKKRELLKAEYEKKSEELKNKKEEIKKELKNKLGEIRGEVFMRFEIAIERITQIQTKLTTRIDTYQTEGKDMSSAKALLDSSKSHSAKAKDLVAQAKAKATSISSTTSDTATTSTTDNSINQAVRDEVRALLKDAKEELKLAHSDLRESFKAIIKVLVPESIDDDSNDDSSGDDATGSNQ